MDDLTMWSLLVGFASPLVISVIQRPSWSDRARVLVTAVFSLVVGGVTAYLSDELTGKTLVSSVLIVLVAALSTYKGLWKPSGLAPAIEVATSPGNQRVEERIVVEPTVVDPPRDGGFRDTRTAVAIALLVVAAIVVFVFAF